MDNNFRILKIRSYKSENEPNYLRSCSEKSPQNLISKRHDL